MDLEKNVISKKETVENKDTKNKETKNKKGKKSYLEEYYELKWLVP
tara:strand:- start:205 stop:342 length:138 start_codon:yes stop_codon:yes gene_type:complete